jgi:hypothetical protein
MFTNAPRSRYPNTAAARRFMRLSGAPCTSAMEMMRQPPETQGKTLFLCGLIIGRTSGLTGRRRTLNYLIYNALLTARQRTSNRIFHTLRTVAIPLDKLSLECRLAHLSSIRGRIILRARHLRLRPYSSALRSFNRTLKLRDELLAQKGRSILAGVQAGDLRCAVTHFLWHPFASLRRLMCREITRIDGRPFSARIQTAREFS